MPPTFSNGLCCCWAWFLLSWRLISQCLGLSQGVLLGEWDNEPARHWGQLQPSRNDLTINEDFPKENHPRLADCWSFAIWTLAFKNSITGLFCFFTVSFYRKLPVFHGHGKPMDFNCRIPHLPSRWLENPPFNLVQWFSITTPFSWFLFHDFPVIFQFFRWFASISHGCRLLQGAQRRQLRLNVVHHAALMTGPWPRALRRLEAAGGEMVTRSMWLGSDGGMKKWGVNMGQPWLTGWWFQTCFIFQNI